MGKEEGDKQFQGDQKTPEGAYIINTKNANSEFHKNLGISYPTDTLIAWTDHFKNMPNIPQFKTGVQFYSGTMDQIMLRYMVAKYEVGQWYSREKLTQLMKDLNSEKSFDEAFNR